MNVWRRRAIGGLVLGLSTVSAPLHAQRTVRWDSVDVTAHLDAAGELLVTEAQTIVFNGAWNGGERRFTLHPGQRLRIIGLTGPRPGGSGPMVEDTRLDDVGDYARNGTTLRWRARRAEDAPFDHTSLRYEIRYAISGGLAGDGDHYLLNHDFAFADRDGTIERFTLRLTLDPVWQPLEAVPPSFTGGPLPPGRSFVVRVPLATTGPPLEVRNTGGGLRAIRPPADPAMSRLAIGLLLSVSALMMGWFFLREERSGRFAPVSTEGVDPAWLRQHILTHPAEVVGAAWDGLIGRAEVVALIARMVNEGKLESEVAEDGGDASMTLRLKVDRGTLNRQESSLVDGLFFDGRSETTTADVKSHYEDSGFDPAAAIRDEVKEAVDAMLADADEPRRFRWGSALLSFCAVAALMVAWMVEGWRAPVAIAGAGMLVVACVGWIVAILFRAHIQWGRKAALACLAPALVILGIASGFLLWFAAELSIDAPIHLVALVILAIALIDSQVNALRSRQHGRALAVRKTLARGRAYLAQEFDGAPSELRHEWYPWALAFGLEDRAGDWSAHRRTDAASSISTYESPDLSSRPSGSSTWSGFGGGRSGAAGASGSWAAAAGGIAAGVRTSRSRADADGGSSWGGDSGSSSDGGSSSSGGGGGGGW